MLIYRIVLGFLAPDKVDSKFFDPKFAFKEIEVQAKTVTELVTKKKPKVCLGNGTTLRFWNSGEVGPGGSYRQLRRAFLTLFPSLRLKAMLRATSPFITELQSPTFSELPTLLTSSPKPAK